MQIVNFDVCTQLLYFEGNICENLFSFQFLFMGILFLTYAFFDSDATVS